MLGDLGEGSTVDLTGPQSHYLRNVMRLKPGAAIRLFNGRAGEWRADVEELGKKGGRALCAKQTRTQVPLSDVHFLFAPLKQVRLDYMAQKATEMGACVLQPVKTQFTMVARIKRDRLIANTIEAAEQCNLLAVPQVEELASLRSLMEDWDPARRLIHCDESAPVTSALAALQALARGPLAVLIGPEGGFSPEEREQLRAHPAVTAISLGPRVMRADTAAVAAMAVVQAVLGDWS